MTNVPQIPDTIRKRLQVSDSVVFTALAAFSAYALYNILPYALTFVSMATSLVGKLLILGGMLGVGAFVLMNLGNIIKIARVVSRKVMNQIVAVEPIGFMEERRQTVEEKMKEVLGEATKLSGAIRRLEEDKRALEKEIRTLDNNVRNANGVGERQAAMWLRDLDRKQGLLEETNLAIANLSKYQRAVQELREIANVNLQDLESMIDTYKRKLEIGKVMGGLGKLRDLMNMSNDDVWDTAVLAIDTTYNDALASMDILVEDMRGALDNKRTEESVAISRIAEMRSNQLQVRVESPSRMLVSETITATVPTTNSKIRVTKP